jgi:hypothetical protein
VLNEPKDVGFVSAVTLATFNSSVFLRIFDREGALFDAKNGFMA